MTTPPQPPQGPQSPGPGPESPQSPPPQSPQAPQSPAYPPPPQQQYGGPVPPGGWQQPVQPSVPGGQLASWGSRVGATLIDGLILLIPSAIVLSVLGVGVLASGDDTAGFFAFIGGLILTFIVLGAILLLYAPLLMMRQGQNNGQTIGKQLLGIRVIRDNGQPFTFGPAALREVVIKNLAVGIASSIIPLIPWFLNYFWPLWDDQNRALHDMVCSTHVVKA